MVDIFSDGGFYEAELSLLRIKMRRELQELELSIMKKPSR
jgi:hypothetical protein